MKKPLLVIAILVLLIYGCQEAAPYISTLLGTSKLSSQIVTIDVTKDTIVRTGKGALIRIAKGSLDAGNNTTVQLEIKEAYSMQDILKGGLSTRSNGQALSSGGMLFINPVPGSDARIVKPIAVATPTRYIQPGMQLFKGEVATDSAINWVDPKPLPANPQQAQLETGKKMFADLCATCHRIEKPLTGPALAHAVKRFGGRKFRTDTGEVSALYAFTLNNTRVLASGEPYYNYLYKVWHKSAMNIFPSLTTKDMDALYGYIENESDRLNMPMPDYETIGGTKCDDSCLAYYQAMGNLYFLKNYEEIKTRRLVNDTRVFTDTSNLPFDTTSSEIDTQLVDTEWPEMVSPLNNESLYYQFNIDSFGWYNIDILVKDIGAVPSTLRVHIQPGDSHFALYLAIPSIKGLFPAGPLKDQPGTYGFFEANGDIPLPQNVTAYLFALGENGEQMVYADTAFTTAISQEFTLSPKVVSKEAFDEKINSMNLKDVKITADKHKDTPIIRTVTEELKKAALLKPKNCNCGWAEADYDYISKPNTSSIPK